MRGFRKGCGSVRRPRWLPVLAVAGLLSGLVAMAPPARAVPFSNTTSISIADATNVMSPSFSEPGVATPYPSTITVGGLMGLITDLNVSILGINGFPDELGLLLVGPGGQKMVILSDAGSVSVSGLNLTLDDQAAAVLPTGSFGSSPVTARPTDYLEAVIAPNQPTDSWPSPAPAGPYSLPAPAGMATFASVFGGSDPNGVWSLYAVDDLWGTAVSISGGWSLDITVSAAAAATTTAVVSSVNPSETGQSVTFTATVSASGTPVTEGTVTFTEGATLLAGPVAVDGSGQAQFTTSALAEGDHLIVATYNGTGSFATSNDSVNQRVDNDTVVTGNTYCNPGPVALAPSGVATPYPSNIFVTGAPDPLGKVTVELKDVSHVFSEDIDILLAGPAGQNLVLASDAGQGPTAGVSVTFDDDAPDSLPASGSWTTLAKPTDQDPMSDFDLWPSPAPTPSAATALATFAGTDPDGTWSLFVVDDSNPNGGSIAGGWCLTFSASTVATPTTTTITSSANPSVVGQSVTFTATVTDTSVTPTGTVTFTSGVTTLAGPVAVDGAGQAEFTTSSLLEGMHEIVASYLPDAGFSSSSDSLTQTVTTAPVGPPADPCDLPPPMGYNLIDGTDGPNTLTGTPANDFIRGFGGNDVIDGNGGSDILCGGEGDDRIWSKRKKGNSDSGPDVISGGGGHDRIVGGPAGNLIFGGAGNDVIDVLGSGDDEIYGGDGNDVIMAGGGDDLLDGGAGNDDLGGGAGDDTLVGGDGDDDFFAGAGTDSCDGGDGSDIDVTGECTSSSSIP